MCVGQSCKWVILNNKNKFPKFWHFFAILQVENYEVMEQNRLQIRMDGNNNAVNSIHKCMLLTATSYFVRSV